jgi:hypothetical protein
MDSDQMSKILVRIGLVHVVGKFQKETISPEIVHMLPEYEMKILVAAFFGKSFVQRRPKALQYRKS